VVSVLYSGEIYTFDEYANFLKTKAIAPSSSQKHIEEEDKCGSGFF